MKKLKYFFASAIVLVAVASTLNVVVLPFSKLETGTLTLNVITPSFHTFLLVFVFFYEIGFFLDLRIEMLTFYNFSAE